MIWAILAFLLSLPGMVALGLGVVLFFFLPVIPKITGVCHWINRIYLHLAAAPIKRAAAVVSEHDDAIFKTMTFDARGVEKIRLDGETKDFEDPDGALHHWLNTPFALADEAHGVLFDPRHAALGARKNELREHDEDEFDATAEEWQEWDVSKWVPGVFEMPRRHEMVNLSMVRELVQGGERAEYPGRVETLYKNSRIPFASALSSMKLLMPAAAFVLTFGGIWLIVTKLGDGSGGSTVGYGASVPMVLMASVLQSETFGDLDPREVAVSLTLLVVPFFAIIILVLINPILGVAFTVTVAIGFGLLPTIATLSRPIPPLAGVFSKLFFTLGFLGFRQPVFEWTPRKYVIREYDELETTGDVRWYSLFNSLVGFTYAPSRESWGAEYLDHQEIKNRREAVADGGVGGVETNIPRQYTRAPSMRRDSYGPFVPKTLKRSKYYLHSAIATSRFNHCATGEKSLRRLLEAKEDGEDSLGVSDKVLLYATCGGGLLGVAMGVLLFL